MARREKSKTLLGKSGAAEHEKYVNFILPRQSGEVTFRETILTKIFGEQSSLFNTRWQCLRKKIVKTTQLSPVQLTGTVKSSS